MKMAEVDALTGWVFSQKNKNYENISSPIYFADICAGPGGFSEYILWRTQWHGKGEQIILRSNKRYQSFPWGSYITEIIDNLSAV